MKAVAHWLEIVKEFPVTPGVYVMKNALDKVIYVGKAKNLRARVRSYFHENAQKQAKVRFLVRHVETIEYLLTANEVDAFLLEASLIKKHQPRYNVRLKDDKAYPYIRISLSDTYPRLYLARKVKRGSDRYFGPYGSGAVVRHMIDFLNKHYKIRDCRDAVMTTRKRPCLTHQMGACEAPCVEFVSEKDYRKNIGKAIKFLESQPDEMVHSLRQQMSDLAEQEKFELAAQIRDQLLALEAVVERQEVIGDASADMDIIGYGIKDEKLLVETLHIRHGQMIGSRAHLLKSADDLSDKNNLQEMIISFLNQYYEDNVIPDQVVVAYDLSERLKALLANVLAQRRGKTVQVLGKEYENAKRLISVAMTNALNHLEQYKKHLDPFEHGLEQLKRRLSLSRRPRRMECYDISHLQGQEIVGSQVVFEDGEPDKNQYRLYRVKTLVDQNDYEALREVLKRRVRHTEYEDPDLIVIDGGKSQLRAVQKIMDELAVAWPVVSLAKARTESAFQKAEIEQSEERVFVPNRENPIVFEKNSQAFRILTHMRNEAHRFAIEFHRRRRDKDFMSSELDRIEGLGSVRKKQLLTEFGSVEGLREASPEEVSKLPGISRRLADTILAALKDTSEQ